MRVFTCQNCGQLLHFENLLVLHVLVVGLTRSADALAWDARRNRSGHDRELEPATAYGWPVRLAALVSRLERCLADPGSYRREYAQRHADVRARVYGAWADGHSAERCARRLQQVL